jgi:hypothetical protein
LAIFHAPVELHLNLAGDDFAVKLDRIHPRYDETLQLPFFDEEAAN